MTRPQLLLVVGIGLGLLVAGCTSPGDGGDEEGPEFTSQNESALNQSDDTPTPDQDVGAEPLNPPDDQNRTNATQATDAPENGNTSDAGGASGGTAQSGADGVGGDAGAADGSGD